MLLEQPVQELPGHFIGVVARGLVPMIGWMGWDDPADHRQWALCAQSSPRQDAN